MHYTEFKNSQKSFPLLMSADILRFAHDRQAMLNQLLRWQHRGLILKLKKGIYLLNDNDRTLTPSREFIAQQMYGPSYVSLEYALGVYGLIPEGVVDITCITTKKTMRITNPRGTFIYQHIKPMAFRGFTAVRDSQGLSYFIAEPEKALVDFLYLNLARFKSSDIRIFSESFRFQNTDILHPRKIDEWTKLFSSKKLLWVAKDFLDFRKEETRA